MKRRALLVALVLLVLSVACARAQTDMRADVGYEGIVPGGRWFPLRIAIEHDGEALDALVAIDLIHNNQDTYDRYEFPVRIEPGTTRASFPIRYFAPQWTLAVTLRTGETVIAQAQAEAAEIIGSYAYLVGVLGGSSALSASLTEVGRENLLGRMEQFAALRLTDALDTMMAKELDGFSALVIDGVDVGALDAAQQAMLQRWLDGGGVAIVGPESAKSWFGALTGVHVGDGMQSTGLGDALAQTVGVQMDMAALGTVYPLIAGEDAWAIDAQGSCLLARSRVGEGLVLTCGFPLTDESVLQAARDDALWQRMLLAADTELYNEGLSREDDGGALPSSSLLYRMTVSEGVSILPVVAALAAYVLIAGIGLFIALRRIDRTRMLWVCLPVCAVGALVLVMALSGVLDLNEPAVASVRVTQVDEAGRVSSSESALVSYADAGRVRISTEDALSIGRSEYVYYNVSEVQEECVLRDVRTAGEQPAIELSAAAPWKTRLLSIGRENGVPDNSLSVRAWMEEDGLHAVVVNEAGVTLRGAMLVTKLGYAVLGDIAPGEVREAALCYPDVEMRVEGKRVLRDGECLRFPMDSIGEVIVASAASDDGADRARERMLASSMSVGVGFGGIVVADCPELPCATLVKDGERIGRSAQESIVCVSTAFETVSESGHFYCPPGTFAMQNTVPSGDGYVLTGESKRYAQPIGDGVVVGYDLSAITGTVSRILIDGGASDSSVQAEVFDCAAGTWVSLGGSSQLVIGSELTGRVIDGSGRLLLRYTSQRSGSELYRPVIIVEGEGGERK